MKIAFFDTRSYEKDAFQSENTAYQHEISFLDVPLNPTTAVVAKNHPVVCAFVNSNLSKETLTILKNGGTQLIAMRCAGFNNIDLNAAKELGLQVVRVPEYSPYAIAEHVVAMIQTLNRKTHRAYNRVREGNFSLSGLTGFDLHQKTIGIVGVGKIGKVLAKIMTGFGCKVLLYDIYPDAQFAQSINAQYVDLKNIYSESDIISLHVPLTPETRHMINESSIANMKTGVMLINTGRGALINTRDLISALKSEKIAHAGLDVYEEEENIFFKDLSEHFLTDDILARLLTFPNVLITGHQGFLTHEALKGIASTTLQSVSDFASHRPLLNAVALKP